MSVTIKNVAQEAKVSITTVSRVLNNNNAVKQETRERIEKAIVKLNYKPNIIARALTSKKSFMIGIIVPGITNLFFSTMVDAIEKSIKESGYFISLCITEGDLKEEKMLVEKMIDRQVDGIIVLVPAVEYLIDGFYEDISKRLPTVVISSVLDRYKCNFISYDEEVGTRDALQHLIDLGHKKIAFVRGYRSYSYDLKENIYREMLKSNNLNYEVILNVGKANDVTVVERSQLKLEELLKQSDRPTAVFASNDLMAIGAINACNKLLLTIPNDVSIVGFDNTLLAQISHPKLTSVDQNISELGYKAAQELLYIMENGIQNNKRIILDTTLVIRESSSNATVT